MAALSATALSKSGSVGGVFNMTDEDFIDYALPTTATPAATDAGAILIATGAVPGAIEETWGILVQ